MTSREKQWDMGLYTDQSRSGLFELLHGGGSIRKTLTYDPELLYVECQTCGRPVLWEAGRTTDLLIAAGVDVSRLDERCMIVSEGCPSCSPGSGEGYTLAVVRLAGLTPEEAVHMARPAGTA